MTDFNMILRKLQNSGFRNSFHLSEEDIAIINEKGFKKMKSAVLEILSKRVREKPKNDGRQTPWSGYPVFVAQHATATCCRGCIKKWHNIDALHVLTEREIDYLSDLIMSWIGVDMKRNI